MSGTYVDPNTKSLRWHRVNHPSMTAYMAKTLDGFLRAILSQDPAGKDGALLWHISISHVDNEKHPDRCPTWDEMKHAKFNLVPVDVPMVLIFPRKTAPYVDMHPTTLHLWESEGDIDL